MRSALSFVLKTRSVLPAIKTTLQNANVVMLLDILENHVVSIMSKLSLLCHFILTERVHEILSTPI